MKIIPFCILLFIGFGLQAQHSIDAVLKAFNENSIPYISVSEARMLQLHNEATVLDAREWYEFEISAIPSAKYIGYQSFSPEKILQYVTDKTSPIIVYCSVGIRSEDIALEIKKLGYTNVKNLYGGIFEWKNKGFPVIDLQGNTTEKVHTFSKAWEKYLEKGIKIN